MATPGGVPQIQVFRPTWEEFKDFNNYIAYMESKGAHKAGLAKIIPPPEWKPCPNGYNMEAIGEMEIPAPISQVVQGKQGIYTLFNILKKPMKVKEFRKQAFSAKYATPHHDDYEDLDRKYWRNLSYNSPIYGADVSGSLTDPNVEEWNINKLGSILDYVNEDYKISIDGVNTAYLYFGMWKSSFAWHTEDMDLYSINYIHFGEPKSWYSVPTEYGARLERLANNNFQSFAKECPAFLRHKMTLLSPTILKNNSIPFNKIVQEAGEFMVTFPFGYHAGFNHGFNAAESTNFASPRWVEYGKRASHCYCRPDMVNINMETFVKRFQPDRYELWLAGKDYGCHPEIPQRQYYAPAPQFAPCLNEPTASGSADGDDDEQQPTKNKAKRHLIHDGNRLPAKLQHMEPPVVKMEEDGEMDDDLFEDDEERFEIMKDVLYKAGEIETDGLEQWVDANGLSTRKTPIKPKTGANSWMTDVNVSWSENDTVDEDDSQLSDNGTDSSEDVKPPVTANKIRPRLTATVHPPKPITAVAMPPRYLPPMRRTSLEKHKPSVSKIIVKPVIKTVTPPPAPVPIVVARPVTSFNNFRIPKKTATTTTTTTCHQSVQVKVEPQIPEDARHWTELENSASQALVNMATVFSSDNSNSSSIMTRIQKPSETCFIQHHSSSSYLSDSATRTIPHQLLQPESPSRRPRKQKMPRSRSINTVSAKSTSRTLLWSKQREWTLDREADFNLLSSQTSPFCSVCSLLASDQEENGPIPPSSAVSIPEELFKKESNGKWSRMNSSPLLRCSSCRVCVHARCYGLASDLPALSWLCRRCSRNEETAKCCLCLQRGGALKPTSDNRWAHILCALCFPGVKFADSSTLEPIQVGGCGAGGEQLNSATTLHSNCSFCSDQSDNRNVFYRGICVSCSDRRCQKTFHPTCALVNGVRFTLSGEGRLVSLCCSPGPLQSSSSSAKRKTSSVAPLGLVDISVGQLVYAKHPTGGHRLAAVTDNTDKVTYYRIKFADGSTSDDTYPEDITNYACKEDGPPPAGAAVTVKWTDGKIYHGYYKGSHQRVLYRLTFRDEDQTSVTAERTEFEPAVINDNDDRDSDDDGLDELIDDHYMRQSLPNES